MRATARRTRAQLRKGGEVGFGLSATEAGLLLASGCLVMLFVGRGGELKGSKAAVLRRLPDHRCRALPENSGYRALKSIFDERIDTSRDLGDPGPNAPPDKPPGQPPPDGELPF